MSSSSIGLEPMPTSCGRCQACAACASAGSRAGIPKEARWDGVGELWFDSVEAALAAFATEPFASMLVEDRKKFMGEATVVLRRGDDGYRTAAWTPGRLRRPPMAFDLDAGIEGKSVLLTGGAGGIGREIALAFDAAGARVAVVDLAQDAVDATVAAMGKAPTSRHCLRSQAGRRPCSARRAGRRCIRRRRCTGTDGSCAGAAAERARRQRSRLGHPARRQSQGVVLPGADRRSADVRSGARAGASSISRRRVGRAAGSAVRSPMPHLRAASSR